MRCSSATEFLFGTYRLVDLMSEGFILRTTEPDVVIQIHWTDVGGECLDLFYEACASAARRFIIAFNAEHANGNATVRGRTDALLLPRLPCERNWVIP